MSEQATTSDLDLERPEMDSIDTPETADTSVENTSSEPSSEDDLDAGIDFTSLTPELQAEAKRIEKQFKSAYTRKRQEEAARLKYADYEKEQLRGQLDHYQKQWQAILEDPAKFEAYRQIHGAPVKTNVEPQNFETVNDLISHFQNQITSLEQKLEAKVQERVQSSLTGYDVQVRWDKADETRAATDPNYAKYRTLVHNEIRAKPDYYRNMYTGTNESGVLDIALKNVINTLSPVLNEVKSQAQKTIEKKKSASTFVPTSSNQGEAKELDVKEQIIREIQSKYGRMDV
jgi:hypothetical protein